MKEGRQRSEIRFGSRAPSTYSFSEPMNFFSELGGRARGLADRMAASRRITWLRAGGYRWVLAGLVVLPIVAMGAEALVRARLEAPSAIVGATRVYARPPVLAPGLAPDPAVLENHLRRLGYREAQGREVEIGQYYLGRWGWVIGQRSFRVSGEPEGGGFVLARLDYSGRISRLEDENGRRLPSVALEPELIGHLGKRSGQDLLPVRMEDVPSELVDAVLAVEDRRFFEHHGLDYRRIAAALVADLKAGRVVEGGSTLTQQLAKNLFLSPRRSILRKVREAMMASVLERRYTKDEILQAYLNHVYLGQDGPVGIHGVGRAAEYFFGKDVSTLGLAESALLVALIRAPSLYSPLRHPETAVRRRNLVLELMREAGSISEDELRDASQAPLELRPQAPPIRSARYFLDYLAQLRKAEPDSVRRGQGAIVTTLDAHLQRAAEEAVRTGVARLERDFPWLREEEAGEPLEAALVALDPRTGDILAMVGGRDYAASQFNRAVYGRRQPGSAFKPVVALAALARGDAASYAAAGDASARGGASGALAGVDAARREPGAPRFTLASVLEDEPFEVATPAGVWHPANYDQGYSGEVTLREALERSLNVPFARLGMAIGPGRIVETGRKLGIESPLNPYPSLALGASEVSPLELTRAFGVLAAGGFRADSRTELDQDAGGERVFDPAETYLVTSALRGAVERGTGRGLRDRGFHGDVAAKSGTTNDFRDGWFVGYTPGLVLGVWVGFDHGGRLELPGASVALPIFADFLEEVVGPDGMDGRWGGESFDYPSGLETVEVDPATGLRGGWGCRGQPEIFLQGTAPRESCGAIRADRDTLGRLLRGSGEEISRLLRRLLRGRRDGGG